MKKLDALLDASDACKGWAMTPLGKRLACDALTAYFPLASMENCRLYPLPASSRGVHENLVYPLPIHFALASREDDTSLDLYGANMRRLAELLEAQTKIVCASPFRAHVMREAKNNGKENGKSKKRNRYSNALV